MFRHNAGGMRSSTPWVGSSLLEGPCQDGTVWITNVEDEEDRAVSRDIHCMTSHSECEGTTAESIQRATQLELRWVADIHHLEGPEFSTLSSVAMGQSILNSNAHDEMSLYRHWQL